MVMSRRDATGHRVGSRSRTWTDHEWTEVDGRRVHAAATGRPGSPTVVLVHGQGCSHRYFRPLATRLADRARVVAPDLPGFGLTECEGPALDLRGLSDALAGWLRATGREGAVVVGHSVGCQVVVDTAVHHPEVLGRVVLAGATVDSQSRAWVPQLARLLANSVLERPDLGPLLAGDWARSGLRRYVDTFSHMLADPVEDKVHHLSQSTLLLRGQWDLLSSRAWNRLLVDRLPDGRLTEVPWAGHTLGWTRPRSFARALEDVLAGTDADRARSATLPSG